MDQLLLIPRFEGHCRVELGGPGSQAGRVGVASLHLVAEQLLAWINEPQEALIQNT